jgi:enoyl-CoA hydratase/carnithine racemase
MELKSILLEIEDSIAVVTLNRPEKLNALTEDMVIELWRTLGELDDNDEVRVIIVTGAGRAFCAGSDVSSGTNAFDEQARLGFEGPEVARMKPWNIKKPIIAAINGSAVGAGASIPMQWDIRIAAESARIGFVYVRRGIVPEALASWLLPRLVGLACANDLLLSGRMIGAREALSLGLVSQVWPDAELMERTREFAKDIARNTGPVSVALTKRMIYRQLTQPNIESARELESQAFWWAARQIDSVEGVTAFLQRRKPQWKMKPSRDFPDFLPPMEVT